MTDMVIIIGIFAFVITMAIVTYKICEVITEHDRQRNEYLYGIREKINGVDNRIYGLEKTLERQMQCNTQRLKYMQDDFRIINALPETIVVNDEDEEEDMTEFKDRVDKFCKAYRKYGGNKWNY